MGQADGAGGRAPGGERRYREVTDDFVESRQQDASLPEGYVWVHTHPVYRFLAAVVYGIAGLFTFFYTRLALPIRVENRRVLRECRDCGCFVYGNHTQPIGDCFAPVRSLFPKRIRTVIGTANLGIPVLGKLLPIMGALPIPDSVKGMREFIGAIRYHTERKECVVIYPEAHVWPWCDFIRPYPDTSFRYPVMTGLPAFCMTTTYQKRRHRKKPRVTVYLDGPFYPAPDADRKTAQRQLHDEIYACMKRRSEKSTYQYIHYVREPGA